MFMLPLVLHNPSKNCRADVGPIRVRFSDRSVRQRVDIWLNIGPISCSNATKMSDQGSFAPRGSFVFVRRGREGSLVVFVLKQVRCGWHADLVKTNTTKLLLPQRDHDGGVCDSIFIVCDAATAVCRLLCFDYFDSAVLD